MATRIETKLTKLNEEYDRRLQEIADEFREATLLPFCRRHRLTFLSGNGSWSFYRLDNSPGGHGETVDEDDLRAIAPIESKLGLEAFGGNVQLGHWVQDITKGDL